MIHTFLHLLVEGYLASFLKLIISFLVLHILISFIFTSCYLLLPSSSTLFKLHTVPMLANRPSACTVTINIAKGAAGRATGAIVLSEVKSIGARRACKERRERAEDEVTSSCE
jgi:hypothetical protein